MTETLTAETDLRALAAAVGGWFHPDTRGADYTSLPEGLTADEVDRIIDAAVAAGTDVYAAAVEAVSR
jgi:hypothetical protein